MPGCDSIQFVSMAGENQAALREKQSSTFCNQTGDPFSEQQVSLERGDTD